MGLAWGSRRALWATPWLKANLFRAPPPLAAQAIWPGDPSAPPDAKGLPAGAPWADPRSEAFDKWRAATAATASSPASGGKRGGKRRLARGQVRPPLWEVGVGGTTIGLSCPVEGAAAQRIPQPRGVAKRGRGACRNREDLLCASQLLVPTPCVPQVVLYGSSFTGLDLPSSDVDIVVRGVGTAHDPVPSPPRPRASPGATPAPSKRCGEGGEGGEGGGGGSKGGGSGSSTGGRPRRSVDLAVASPFLSPADASAAARVARRAETPAGLGEERAAFGSAAPAPGLEVDGAAASAAAADAMADVLLMVEGGRSPVLLQVRHGRETLRFDTPALENCM